MIRRFLATLGAVTLSALLLFAVVVRADGWMIDGEHHSFNGPQYGYHVHAYVRAYAYTGEDERCHYQSWSHSDNDTAIAYDYTESLWTYLDADSDPENPSTTTWVYQGVYELDYAFASLPNYPYCPA